MNIGHMAVSFLVFNMKHMWVKLFQFSHIILGNIGMAILHHVYLCGSKHSYKRMGKLPDLLLLCKTYYQSSSTTPPTLRAYTFVFVSEAHELHASSFLLRMCTILHTITKFTLLQLLVLLLPPLLLLLLPPHLYTTAYMYIIHYTHPQTTTLLLHI